MRRSPADRGRAWTGLVIGVILGVVLAGGAFLALLWFVNGAVSAGVEGILKQYVFDGPGASFGTARVDLFHGRFVMTDLKLKGASLSLTVPELEADVPLSKFLSGNGVVRSLRFNGPLVEGTFSLRGKGRGAEEFRIFRSLSRWPIAKVEIANGEIHLVNRDSDVAWGLRNVAGGVLHERGESAGGPYRFKWDGENEAEAPGRFAMDLTLEKAEAPLSFNGEWALQKWPVESLAAFAAISPDVQVISGSLDLKTQAICKNDWLTASHLVDLSDFKGEAAARRKELLGVPVAKFNDKMNIPSRSFVVPMNGSIRDPGVGVASSVQKILYQLFEDCVENKKNLEKWSQRVGAYLGGRVDAELRAQFATQ